MVVCGFISLLNKLRKSSSESIDNVDDPFDNFKKYMHVERDAERNLKYILKEVNGSRKKTLILLCGSAGDGKSHLLSYLKYSDEEGWLDNYKIYNDATESDAPKKTAIETLNGVLSAFMDENLDKPGSNVILAINLGVLNNFIDSPYGECFKALKQYVESANILSSKVNKSDYNPSSHFQHVSFSDYQMFVLENGGINPEYIESLFGKIALRDDTNPFYVSYTKDCSSCTYNSNCPVKKNYLFFSDEKVRRYIALLIVNVIVREKEILTTRELLNYVHDILVPQYFDILKYKDSGQNSSEFLKEYLRCITPSLLFDCNDISSIMNKTHKYDPLLYRDEDADDLAIEYYVADDISKVLEKFIFDSPYVEFKNKGLIDTINSDKVIKPKFFKVLVRLNAIYNGNASDQSFQKYIRYLFSYNAGKKHELSNLYDDVIEAVTNWCGNDSEGNICIDDHNSEFSLYEAINFDVYLENMPLELESKKLNRFLPYIIVEFQNLKKQSHIQLDIDYSLYELMGKLKKGYVQTAEDKNNHADFISFIEKILMMGTADEHIIFLSEKGQKAVLDKTKFGIYKFKVVK